MEDLYLDKYVIGDKANNERIEIAREALKIDDVLKLITDNSVHKLLFDKNLKTCQEILEFIERYKFVPNGKILDLMQQVYRNNRRIKFISVNELKEFKIPDNMVNYIRRNEVLVYNFDEEVRRLTFVTDFFMNVSTNDLELMAGDYTVEYLYVTPYNYQLLKHGRQTLEESNDTLVVFHKILLEALARKASDIHFEMAYCDETKDWRFPIVFRIENRYEEQNLFLLSAKYQELLIKDIFKRETQGVADDIDTPEGIIAFYDDPLKDGKLMLRLCANQCLKGYTLVIRIQNFSTSHWLIDDLGFDEYTTEKLYKFSRRTFGLTVITGPVRSGKNVTATAITREMHKRSIKLVDYSSPTEILLPFTQVQYYNREHLSNLTRLAKKQDIDAILMNEIPDKGIAKDVQDLVDASIGVITTMHIDRVWNICSKLKHYFGEDYKDLLLQTNGVVNQKMYTKLCPHCKEQKSMNSLPKYIKEFFESYNLSSYYEARGCSHCNNVGRLGIQPFAEILDMDSEIKDKIMKAKDLYDTEKTIRDHIMKSKHSLEYVIVDAIKNGVLGYECLDTIL